MANALNKPAKPVSSAEQDANEAWLKYWASRPLPILQSTKAALTGLLNRAASVRNDELVELALRDPLLTAHALRFVNQRPRGSLAADVVSIDNVILLMGVEAFLTQFSRLPSVESVLLPQHPAHYVAVLKEVAGARLAARLARDFGNWRYDARLDEIFVTALLASLPKMLRYLEAGLPDKAPAVNPAAVGLSLFVRWRLPDVFATLLDDSAASSQRGMLHQVAMRLADKLQLGWWQDGIDHDLRTAAQTLGVEQSAVWALVVEILLHFARKDWPYAQIHAPARWLVMQPGEWPKPKSAQAAQDNSKPTLAEILRELQRAGGGGASFNQIMGLAIRAQSEGIGLKRIVFGLLSAGQNILKVRYAIGIAEGDPLRALQIDLSAPHIFTKMLLKPQSVWLNQGNRAQFEALLPRGLRQSLGAGDFVAMSLFVDDRPVGLFISDNGGTPLTAAQYDGFKQVCLATGQCLTQQARRLALGG
ncbi:hypothetical protein [Chitinimonas sp. BJYL2]|uniref:hypothetical protein n=1 Tax=Chitinimonas sp. BJYL2 TaxID=2976696 RepID=UPI0022B490DD|nr:hypothetical protein [Chitinimonas sp. BJYL2]